MKRFSSCSLSLLFIALPLTGIYAQFAWQKTASVDGYPTYKFISFEDELYAAMFGGGVFKTADEGENWIACHTGLSSYLTRDIAADGSTLYVATKDKGVLKSVDKGESWLAASDDLLHLDTWSLLSVKSRLFAGTSNGLYFTDNEGVNWHKASLPRQKAHHRIFFALATNGHSIMAGSSGYVYISNDSGKSWQEVKIPSDFEVRNITVQNDNWLIGTSGDGIFASNDGINWTAWNTVAKNPRSLLLVDNNIILGISTQGVIKDNEIFKRRLLPILLSEA